MNVLFFFFHTYTFYPLELNTYQFDFKLHYLAYVMFMSFPLDYFYFFYVLNSRCITICFNFSSWAAICFNKHVSLVNLLCKIYCCIINNHNNTNTNGLNLCCQVSMLYKQFQSHCYATI